MKKHLIFLTAILLFCTALSTQVKAQTCSGTAYIPPNGSVTINTVGITSSSTGAVSILGQSETSCSNITTAADALWVGGSFFGPVVWNLTLTFDKPVNDLLIVLTATGQTGNEDFIFNSNGGAISISSTNNCYSTITGNTILSGLGGVGGGIFKISAPSAYTQLTINGAGGHNGSMMAICQASIVPAVIPAVLTKSVSPATITEGTNATYTFNIANTTTGSSSLSGLSFTDNLPSGLRIAGIPNVTTTGLTGGTVTAAAGGTSVVATGYTIPANTTATITVDVTNASGQLNANCGSNPAAFTNGSTNMSGLSANLTNGVTNTCLVVTAAAPSCNAGTSQVPLSGSTLNN